MRISLHIKSMTTTLCFLERVMDYKIDRQIQGFCKIPLHFRQHRRGWPCLPQNKNRRDDAIAPAVHLIMIPIEKKYIRSKLPLLRVKSLQKGSSLSDWPGAVHRLIPNVSQSKSQSKQQARCVMVSFGGVLPIAALVWSYWMMPFLYTSNRATFSPRQARLF